MVKPKGQTILNKLYANILQLCICVDITIAAILLQQLTKNYQFRQKGKRTHTAFVVRTQQCDMMLTELRNISKN